MKNSKLRRALLLVACAVMLVSVSVGATLAYLTNYTQVVTNTFSVGNVAITLDETVVDQYGDITDSATRSNGNAYKLIPGHAYTKDPTVHVTEGSEDGWLFVKIVNPFAEEALDNTTEFTVEYADSKNGNQAKEETTQGSIYSQMTTLGWVLLESDRDIWAYTEKVSGNDHIPVFKGFKLDGEVNVDTYDGEQITVQAYIVQADGFDGADGYASAWFAAPYQPWLE